MADGALIVCAGPTCRATVLTPPHWSQAEVRLHIRQAGWLLEQQPGDEAPRLYCPRCQL